LLVLKDLQVFKVHKDFKDVKVFRDQFLASKVHKVHKDFLAF
jgi:hypothetical protein